MWLRVSPTATPNLLRSHSIGTTTSSMRTNPNSSGLGIFPRELSASSDMAVPRKKSLMCDHTPGETTVSPVSASGSAVANSTMGGPARTYSQRLNTPPTWMHVSCPQPIPLWSESVSGWSAPNFLASTRGTASHICSFSCSAVEHCVARRHASAMVLLWWSPLPMYQTTVTASPANLIMSPPHARTTSTSSAKNLLRMSQRCSAPLAVLLAWVAQGARRKAAQRRENTGGMRHSVAQSARGRGAA